MLPIAQDPASVSTDATEIDTLVMQKVIVFQREVVNTHGLPGRAELGRGRATTSTSAPEAKSQKCLLAVDRRVRRFADSLGHIFSVANAPNTAFKPHQTVLAEIVVLIQHRDFRMPASASRMYFA